MGLDQLAGWRHTFRSGFLLASRSGDACIGITGAAASIQELRGKAKVYWKKGGVTTPQTSRPGVYQVGSVCACGELSKKCNMKQRRQQGPVRAGGIVDLD